MKIEKCGTDDYSYREPVRDDGLLIVVGICELQCQPDAFS